MKTFLRMSVLAATLLLPAGLAFSHAGHEESERGPGGQAITLKGELVDLSCYMAHEGKGKEHADCAKMCVLGGAPLGIVGPDGTAYLLIEDHTTAKSSKPFKQAKKFTGQTVTIKGDAYKRGGVQAIVVDDVVKE